MQQPYNTLFCTKKSPCVLLKPFKKVNLICKRDDLNHPTVQGNKLRKLKYNFLHALENNFSQLATFGGAYSNHIVAIAQAAKLSNIKVLGFIRGNELRGSPEKWSQTLHDANNAGMELVFLSRQEYRQKEQSLTVENHLSQAQRTYLIPEGGSNKLALLGVVEIIDELAEQIEPPTHIITACGTGGTCAGLIDGVAKHGWQTKVIGIPVLKGAKFLQQDIKNLSQQHSQVDWQLYFNYHGGGYAKLEERQLLFGKTFSQSTNIPLDKVYNVKSFFATYDLIKKGEINAKSSVVILHTGGLQGGVIGIPESRHKKPIKNILGFDGL